MGWHNARAFACDTAAVGVVDTLVCRFVSFYLSVCLSVCLSVGCCPPKAVEDLLLALTRVPQAVPQMVQTAVPFFSQVRQTAWSCSFWCLCVAGVYIQLLRLGDDARG